LKDGNLMFRLYLAALIGPAGSVFFAAREITASFAEMARTGTGGLGTVAAILSEAADCVLAALLVSWLAAFAGAVVVSLRSTREDGSDSHVAAFAATVGSLLACVPAAILRVFSRFVLNIANPLANQNINLEAVTSRTATLLLACAYSALAAGSLLCLAMLIAPAIVRAPRRTNTLVLIWFGQAFLGIASLLTFRWSRALYEVAVRGSL
jgi:hypothetical protein